MNSSANNKILSLMLQQFRQKHRRNPKHLVVVPLAMLALAIKQSLAPEWEGIPVVCREVAEHEVAQPGETAVSLAVFVNPEHDQGVLRSCDLKA